MRIFALLWVMLFGFAGLVSPAVASVLEYQFRAPPGDIICRAPNSGSLNAAHGAPRDCADTELFDPIGGGLPVSISAIPTSVNAYGGLNVYDEGIGVGNDGDGAFAGESPGRERVSVNVTPSQGVRMELLRLDWDIAVSLRQLSITSSGPTQTRQYFKIVSGTDGRDLTGPLGFKTGNMRSRVTTYTFDTPLFDSSFLLEPVYVLEDDAVGGFFLAGVDVTPVPVPPALPLLGGAIALLVWRSRAARRSAAA